MLCADGTTPDAHCDVEVAWFADCNNPASNDPIKCLNHYGDWFRGVSTPLSESPEVAALPYFKLGADFDYQAPLDFLQGEVSVADQGVRYGTGYVYFAACAGKLYPAPGLTDQVPVQCHDRVTGAPLDQKRFVAGVTTLYGYDTIRNDNPTILASALNRTLIPTGTCTSDAECGRGFTCTSDKECVPVVELCNRSEHCPAYCFSINVAAQSFALTSLDGTIVTNPPKSLWVEYYTNAGSVPDEGDARFGMRMPQAGESSVWSPCAAWQRPAKATDNARIWLVLRDDRGGITWHTQRIIVR
jgi:hypothetical protein